jgi:very-short-patch-repair endonuclease
MQSPAPLLRQLDQDRGELLDLTSRNRLLHTPLESQRSTRIDVRVGDPDAIFQRLVLQTQSCTFAPRSQPNRREPADAEPHGSATGGEFAVDPTPPAETLPLGGSREPTNPPHHGREQRLLTELDADGLERRLRRQLLDAQTFEQEQGVNVLYLAIGFLKWFEADSSDRPRYAPLLLIPVQLTRTSIGAHIRVHYSGEEISTNLSLAARLKHDFSIELPEIEELEEQPPSVYLSRVRQAVARQARWEVLADRGTLWFFSFSKFLMYRDLDPTAWPEHAPLAEQPLLQQLFGDGFPCQPPLVAEGESIDPVLPTIDSLHVMDADSSQSLVIEEVRQGRNLVIQGPPGTGKSQTITNLIAAAVADGKTVLFMAEKMAALEVVHRRLEAIGLGDICLELHSQKAKKQLVLEQLAASLNRAPPEQIDVSEHCRRLEHVRTRINAQTAAMHRPLEPSDWTPFQLLGHLVQLRQLGHQPAPYRLEAATSWSRAEFDERLEAVHQATERAGPIGIPLHSPWLGIEAVDLLPTDVDRLLGEWPALMAHLQRLLAAGNTLAESLGCPAADTLQGIARLARTAKRLADPPTMDRRAMADPVWHDQRDRLVQLVERGAKARAGWEDLRAQFSAVVWQADLARLRQDLASGGGSWLRWLRARYRQALGTLRGLMTASPPQRPQEQLRLVDQLLEIQGTHDWLKEANQQQLGIKGFGSQWHGPESNWEQLAAVLAWEAQAEQASIDPRFRQSLGRIPQDFQPEPYLREVGAVLRPADQQLQQLSERLKLDSRVLFGRELPTSAWPLTPFLEKLAAWQAEPAGLMHWSRFQRASQRLATLGLAHLADELHGGRIPADAAVGRFKVTYFDHLLRLAREAEPSLAEFDGQAHERLLEEFRQLDIERIALARRQVNLAHHQRLPRGGSGGGEVGLLRREIQKKRRHLPIRRLLREAGQAIQRIKPVLMMSPISVAQFLEPGRLEFDLLIVDEASQVPPVEALGGIARCRQLVVVGDSQQLPPTRFFSRFMEQDELPQLEEDGPRSADLESILALCAANGVPERMLSWHYRSQHHSLIAVSNREFYRDRLLVVPSPEPTGPQLGLGFRLVPDGVYDRGGAANNRREAEVVADAVMAHAHRYPDLSLGVGTFSVQQRDAVLDALEQRRRQDPSAEGYFANHPHEPFFVKNLENIQGDERDVIFISVGYGRDSGGYLSMAFGPVSNQGGDRRLNVLFTRARRGCQIFSSLQAHDIDLTRATGRGPAVLKTFLHFAESGILEGANIGTGEHDSLFEQEVAQRLVEQGYPSHAQVGAAGFRIDLAILDPERPGRYLLGVECDGATYHSSRSARDRDRLRQSVLESRGWRIHRIWSTDWFRDPDRQLRQLLERLEQARLQPPARTSNPQPPTPDPSESPPTPPASTAPKLNSPPNTDHNAATAPFYQQADFPIPDEPALHDLPRAELADHLCRIIAVEGPIHRREVARRLVQLSKLRRTGARIQQRVDDTLRWLISANRLRLEDQHFLSPPHPFEATVRDRSQVASATLRQIEMLPPTEIRQAVQRLVNDQIAIAPEEVITETARTLGYRSTSEGLRELIQSQIDQLLASGRIELRDDRLVARATA